MAWPDLDELKRKVDVTSTDWDDDLSADLAAAIGRVKSDVGDWDETTDSPDPQLSRAAMRAAIFMNTNADRTGSGLDLDPIYQSLLKGHRRRFGIA